MNPALLAAAELKDPPFLDRWVLEQPWPAAVALVVAGLLLFWALQQRAQAGKGLIALAICILLAAGAVVAGTLVETDRERLTRQTTQLVSAVAASDVATVDRLLSDGLVTLSAGDEVAGFGKPDVLAVVRGFDGFGLTKWTQEFAGAGMDNRTVGRTRVTVKVEEAGGQKMFLPSTWEFAWVKHNDGSWKVSRIECLTMFGRPPSASWAGEARRMAR